MKKILLIGKFDEIFSDFCVFSDQLLDVQICVDSIQMVKGMLKLKRPEAVVVSLIGISADAESIFGELKENYPKTPVVCIGKEDAIDAYANCIGTSQFTTLTSPTDNENIIDTIKQVLENSNISTNDNNSANDANCENQSARKRILLVDDSNIQLRALHVLLKDKYDVRMATSGTQALTLVGKEKPDMIFLDYEMPICDGRRVLELLREEEGTKDIPVVFLTGVSDKEHIKAVLELKPAGYLLKPADASRIFEIIEKDKDKYERLADYPNLIRPSKEQAKIIGKMGKEKAMENFRKRTSYKAVINEVLGMSLNELKNGSKEIHKIAKDNGIALDTSVREFQVLQALIEYLKHPNVWALEKFVQLAGETGTNDETMDKLDEILKAIDKKADCNGTNSKAD